MGSHGLRSEPSSRRVWGQRPGQPYDIVMMKEDISFHCGYFFIACNDSVFVVQQHIDGLRSSNRLTDVKLYCVKIFAKLNKIFIKTIDYRGM